MTAVAPSSESELAASIADAAARSTPLAVVGGGTHTGLGRPMQTASTVSSAGLDGITLYEPPELVISARSGTPLAAVEAALAEKRQRLAFEPPDHRLLYGTSGSPTIGAVVATNASGPRRIQSGAARDSLIGVRAINGSGEVVKSGGRVMKNVTGYDVAKFLAGSHGTLAVLTEVTFKVQPAPETEATLIIEGMDDADAVAALSAGLGSPFTVTGAAHQPVAEGAAARTMLRIEGFEASVAERSDKLAKLLSEFGSVGVLADDESRARWLAVGDLASLGAPPEAAVWKVSVKPTNGPVVAAAAGAALDCRVLYDWGGGLVWIVVDGGVDDGGARVIRAEAKRLGGHATLVRAPDAMRLAVDVFEPPAAAVKTLARKLKATFDPAGILNPGRMYADM
ncbi:MAG: glycolate oxidase subunit GlcE [Hyphomicrobiales bacterium]|nr:glycolate oxidase subunit GlcE [Hyphomicrobiales bacterium]